MSTRFFARTIDGVIVAIAYLMLSAILDGFNSYLGTVFSYALLFGLYEVPMIALRGATFGKSTMRIKVVGHADGGVPGWAPSAIRFLIPLMGAFIFGIGQWIVYISPFFDAGRRRRGWHDKAAGTVVTPA